MPDISALPRGSAGRECQDGVAAPGTAGAICKAEIAAGAGDLFRSNGFGTDLAGEVHLYQCVDGDQASCFRAIKLKVHVIDIGEEAGGRIGGVYIAGKEIAQTIGVVNNEVCVLGFS